MKNLGRAQCILKIQWKSDSNQLFITSYIACDMKQWNNAYENSIVSKMISSYPGITFVIWKYKGAELSLLHVGERLVGIT